MTGIIENELFIEKAWQGSGKEISWPFIFEMEGRDIINVAFDLFIYIRVARSE